MSDLSSQRQDGRRPALPPRALVVEDEPPLARLVASYLERDGFAVSLVEDLEMVSRAEERQLDLRLGSVDPGVLVTRAVQAAELAYAAKGVGLQASVDRALPAVSADADRLGEVLGNLLGNALRHTPGGGRVQVSAHMSTGADQVDLVVADNGEGIPPELLDRVFERFFRTDPARTRDGGGGGSGLGLTISRAIVEAHGGRV